MVPLAVELPQITAEVGADVPHDLLAAREEIVGEHSPTALRGEDQMRGQGVDDATSPA